MVIWAIKGYEDTLSEYFDLIGYSPPALSGMPRQRPLLRPTESKLSKLADEKFKIINAVELALERIPEELREGIYKKLVNGEPYDLSKYGRAVWSDYEAEYLYHIASELNLISDGV